MLHSVLVLIIALATIPWSKIAEFHPKIMFPFFFLKEECTIRFINEGNFRVTTDKTTFLDMKFWWNWIIFHGFNAKKATWYLDDILKKTVTVTAQASCLDPAAHRVQVDVDVVALIRALFAHYCRTLHILSWNYEAIILVKFGWSHNKR